LTPAQLTGLHSALSSLTSRPGFEQARRLPCPHMLNCGLPPASRFPEPVRDNQGNAGGKGGIVLSQFLGS